MEKLIFKGELYDTLTADVEGFTLTARLEPDQDHGAPWDEEDGHGPVSDWTRRAKHAGERILYSDRNSYRYYDWAEAIRIAKRDGWNAPPYTGTAGQCAARAVEADFQRLRAWCNDDWFYVGVIISVSRNGIMLDECAASLWGIESDCTDYLTEVANELASEALAVGRAACAALTITDDDFEEVDQDDDDEEPADKPEVLLPDWLVEQYERRAAAEREDGGSCCVNERLPTVTVKLANGEEYFFQGDEAQRLIDEVPDNMRAADFILASAQSW